MSLTPIRYSGQGKAMIAPYSSNPVFRELGRVPKMALEPKMTNYDEFDTEDGTRALISRLIQQRELGFNLTLEHFSKENLAMRLYGESAVINAGTVTAETLPTVAVGDIVYLKNRKITAPEGVSSLVLTDSTAVTPVTLTAGTHYSLDSAAHGRVSIKSITTLVQPIKAAYGYGSVINLPMLTDVVQKEFSVAIEILNTYDGSLIHIDLWKVMFEPKGALDLIQEKGVESGDLTGQVLWDKTKESDPLLGQFGRIQLL